MSLTATCRKVTGFNDTFDTSTLSGNSADSCTIPGNLLDVSYIVTMLKAHTQAVLDVNSVSGGRSSFKPY
jgi:hypothetical protein